MERWHNYCVVRYQAHLARDERLNVGILVFHDDTVDLAIADRLDKVKAISTMVDAAQLRESLETLVECDSFARNEGAKSIEDRLNIIRGFTAFDFSALSRFSSRDDESYSRNVFLLLENLVNPEPFPTSTRARRSNLTSELSSIFKRLRVLALPEEGLGAHRIIPNYRLAEGLSADFLLKNGKYHIIKTADLSTDGMHINRIVQKIAVAALTIEQSKVSFGDNLATPTLMYRASNEVETLARAALNTAENQGARLVNWESRDDRIRLIDTLAALAEPLPQGGGNALSEQMKFRLN